MFSLSNVTIKSLKHDMFKKEVTLTLKFPFEQDELDELNNLRKNKDLEYTVELSPVQMGLPGFESA